MDEKIKKKKNNFFDLYISKVLKQISEKCEITFNAKQQVNSFICIFCKYIANVALELTIFGKRKTLSEKEITNALKITLSGELLKNSLIEGDNAVLNFKTCDIKSLCSRQNKAHIIFPPSITEKFLRNFGNSKIMVTSLAPIFFAAVAEYICYEILDLSSIYCKDNKRSRITVRDLEISVRNDIELNNLFINLDVSFLGGGVIPFIHSSMTKKKKPQKVQNIKNRFRPGTIAIRDIKKQQKSDCLILSKSYFEKVVRNIFNENKTDGDFKIKKDVFIILQYFIEQYIVKLFYNSNFLAIHSGRIKLISLDIAMVSYLCDKFKNPYISEVKDNLILSIAEDNANTEENIVLDEISITVGSDDTLSDNNTSDDNALSDNNTITEEHTNLI